MNANLWRLDQRAGLLPATLVFLAFELVLRTKLGTVFMLASVWAMVHQELVGRVQGAKPGFTGERLLAGFYYGLIMAAVIFAVFAVLNITLRSINNSWTYFQLP